MTDEEKQAIEKFVRLNQKHLNNEKIEGKDYLSYWEGFLITNLIDNQQKEIEERLEEIDSLYKMMSAKDDKIEQMEEDYQILKDDIEGHRIVYVDTLEFEEKYISKDKIRKEIEEIKNCRLSTCDEQINKSLNERYEIEDEICEYFEELLQSGQESDQEGGQENE